MVGAATGRSSYSYNVNVHVHVHCTCTLYIMYGEYLCSGYWRPKLWLGGHLAHYSRLRSFKALLWLVAPWLAVVSETCRTLSREAAE